MGPFGAGMIHHSLDRCCVYPEKMLHGILIVLSGVMIAVGPPPLSEIDHVRLEATVDGRDSRGEGFATLVENTRLWKIPFEKEDVPDMNILRGSPAMFRGDLFSVEGVVQQQAPLGPPWEGISEWFVRDAHGIPFMLYVVGDIDIEIGNSIAMTARFYKTMSFEGRDMQIRLYPTFVAPSVAINHATPAGASYALLLFVPLLALASIVVFVLARSGKRKTQRQRFVVVQTDDVINAMSESSSMLSDDPAQALGVMYDNSEIDV